MTHSIAILNPIIRVYRFYLDGFRSMPLGLTLWAIISIKLTIMFGVLKVIFFQNYRKTNFSTDQQRADYVLEQLNKSSAREVKI